MFTGVEELAQSLRAYRQGWDFHCKVDEAWIFLPLSAVQVAPCRDRHPFPQGVVACGHVTGSDGEHNCTVPSSELTVG